MLGNSSCKQNISDMLFFPCMTCVGEARDERSRKLLQKLHVYGGYVYGGYVYPCDQMYLWNKCLRDLFFFPAQGALNVYFIPKSNMLSFLSSNNSETRFFFGLVHPIHYYGVYLCIWHLENFIQKYNTDKAEFLSELWGVK